MNLENWNTLPEYTKIENVKLFAAAKDAGSLFGDGGKLAGAAEKAYRLVKESGLYK